MLCRRPHPVPEALDADETRRSHWDIVEECEHRGPLLEKRVSSGQSHLRMRRAPEGGEPEAPVEARHEWRGLTGPLANVAGFEGQLVGPPVNAIVGRLINPLDSVVGHIREEAVVIHRTKLGEPGVSTDDEVREYGVAQDHRDKRNGA